MYSLGMFQALEQQARYNTQHSNLVQHEKLLLVEGYSIHGDSYALPVTQKLPPPFLVNKRAQKSGAKSISRAVIVSKTKQYSSIQSSKEELLQRSRLIAAKITQLKAKQALQTHSKSTKSLKVKDNQIQIKTLSQTKTSQPLAKASSLQGKAKPTLQARATSTPKDNGDGGRHLIQTVTAAPKVPTKIVFSCGSDVEKDLVLVTPKRRTSLLSLSPTTTPNLPTPISRVIKKEPVSDDEKTPDDVSAARDGTEHLDNPVETKAANEVTENNEVMFKMPSNVQLESFKKLLVSRVIYVTVYVPKN